MAVKEGIQRWQLVTETEAKTLRSRGVKVMMVLQGFVGPWVSEDDWVDFLVAEAVSRTITELRS